MTAIINFFSDIMNIITTIFGFIADVFRLVASIPGMIANLFSMISSMASLLPPPLIAALVGGIVLISIFAVVKMLGFGGTAAE